MISYCWRASGFSESNSSGGLFSMRQLKVWLFLRPGSCGHGTPFTGQTGGKQTKGSALTRKPTMDSSQPLRRMLKAACRAFVFFTCLLLCIRVMQYIPANGSTIFQWLTGGSCCRKSLLVRKVLNKRSSWANASEIQNAGTQAQSTVCRAWGMFHVATWQDPYRIIQTAVFMNVISSRLIKRNNAPFYMRAGEQTWDPSKALQDSQIYMRFVRDDKLEILRLNRLRKKQASDLLCCRAVPQGNALPAKRIN